MFIVAKECNDLIWFQEAARTFVRVPSTVVWSATTAPFPSARLGQERFQQQRQALALILPPQTVNAQVLKEMRIEGCCQVQTLLIIPQFLSYDRLIQTKCYNLTPVSALFFTFCQIACSALLSVFLLKTSNLLEGFWFLAVKNLLLVSSLVMKEGSN